MRKVGDEMNSGRLENSAKWLSEIIQNMEKPLVDLEKSTKTIQGINDYTQIMKSEKEILEKLESPTPSASAFNKGDLNNLESLGGKQNQLSQKTNELRKELQRLSRKTANLGVPLTQSLSDAASEMKQAGENLGRSQTFSAQRHEEAALSHLGQAQQELQQAQNALQQMAGQQGGGSGGQGSKRVRMRGKKPGNSGQKTGKVQLPTAEDYKPPKAFREELLESLKEKFPETYEDIIHKYFKYLSE